MAIPTFPFNKRTLGLLLFGLLASCQPKDELDSTSIHKLEGTWKLLYGMTIEEGDTTYTDYTAGQESFKMLNDSNFAFFRHDLNHGKDSLAVFVSGGGKYTFREGKYTEHLDYCNFREWEGLTFEFNLKIGADTLVQKGIERIEELGVDREIWEYYLRVK